MIRLLRAEVLKVWTTRLWIGLLLGGLLMSGVGAVALLILSGTEEGLRAGLVPIRTVADVQTLAFQAAVMSAFVAVLGATMATGEYRYGTAAGTYLATPSRERVVTAKVLASIPLGFAAGVVAGLLPIVIGAVWFRVHGDPFPFGRPVLIAALEVGLQCAYGAAVATGVGAAIRSQLVAILGLLGWVFIAESLVAALVPSAAKWSPFTGVQGAFGAPDPNLFGHAAAAGMMVLYATSAWFIGVWAERRRDV